MSKESRLKAQLLDEQMGECGYHFCVICGRNPDWRGLALHHIKYRSRMGETQVDNVMILCYSCHSEQHGIREV